MEKRKNSLSSTKVCRFCLTQDITLSSLYERNAKKNNVNLSLKIHSAVSIEVFPSDRMPSWICERCKYFMEMFYEFKHLCRRADENILSYMQNGDDLETVEWPMSLVKLFKTAKPKSGVIKTVVQGGATVEVTQPDASDSDNEEDEEVFNIKIGEGSDDDAKIEPSIKLMKSSGKIKQGYGRLKTVSSTEKPFSCKYCKKRFMKSHHYSRHLLIKHRETLKARRGAAPEQYQCEQCDSSFGTQDELIYHSAIHATQNLTCPLCQEKFRDVDGVTAHIKTHVNGTEFMCDLCELVFTSKEKLDNHIAIAHEDEIRNEGLGDESSMDMEAEDDEEDVGINVKEEDGEMVVEIKKPNEFLKDDAEETEEKTNTNSEESEPESKADSSVDTLAVLKKNITPKVIPAKATTVVQATISPSIKPASRAQVTTILKKAEEIKRKAVPATETPPPKKDKPAKVESTSNSTGASDKSLRLLEKELQELKRTNNRSETPKTSTKPIEQSRNKRPQLHSSTPKPRVAEERKTMIYSKTPASEKKSIERRVITKENKEPKEEKDSKNNNTSLREEKEVKDAKETPKVMKNGSSDRSASEEGSVRRSTRPSKIKDYARMIRDKSQDNDEDDSEDSEEDEEYKQEDKIPEARGRGRPPIHKKPAATPPAATQTPARKRGRPRKEISLTPVSAKKQQEEENTDEKSEKIEEKSSDTTTDTAPSNEEQKPSGVLVSPSGQTLKKVPIKSLPPGVKPLPLPISARPKGELCEMQIGKKVVKVQKIVMTKAEVEAMAKKGLVEMKDGTMVLKQGIKLPTSDPVAFKSSLVGDDSVKESPVKAKPSPTPTRCDIDED